MGIIRTIWRDERARKLNMTLSAVALAAGITITGVAEAGAASAPAPGSVVPASDPFYTAPANIASYQPGQIVATRPVTISISTANRAWQISYRSADSHGAPNMDVTTLVEPTAAWTGKGLRPAVSFQVAEDSTGTQCAPSYSMASSNGAGLDLDLNTMVGDGWAVTDPDYEGPKSAWMAGPQAGHAILDGIRAADSFAAAGLAATTPWALDGYSGGANATGWAAQLAPSYAPQVNLVGVAIGGTPADPAVLAKSLDGGLFSGFEFAATFGINADYPEAGITGLLNAQGVKDLAAVSGQCLSNILTSFAFKTLANDSTSSNPLAVPSVAAVLKEDTLGFAAPTKAPIYDYHANTDEIVPVGQDNTLTQEWCKLGATVDTYRDLVGEHAVEELVQQNAVESFIAARFAGSKPTSTC